MARKPATLSLSSNIELRAAAPLDGRQKVETLADLTAPESFPYHFVGMETYCVESQKWYTLRYDDPTDINNWVVNGTGADGKNGFSVEVQGVEKQGRENIVTFVWKNPEGADLYQDMSVLDGQQGPRGETGERGPKGDDGRSFSIQAQYASEEAMREAHPTGNEGDAYLVENETDTPDLWYWNIAEEDWSCYGPLTGARGDRGPVGPAGFSPDITVAETADNSYKLRITTANGSFVTPNLQGNLAPQDRIDTSANPVQSGTIKTALDAKQDKTLATAVGVRDYTDGVVKNQSTVQTTLEALAAAVNYMNIPVQLISKVDTAEELPANAKPGSICFVGEEGDTPIVYICQDDGTWQKAGGASDDNMVEFTNNEIDNIWNSNANNSSSEIQQRILTVPVWPTSDTFDTKCVWSDDSNTYYSEQYSQYIYDKSTSTWKPKTWNGFAYLYGYNVWSDGDNMCYIDDGLQYILNKTNSTWEPKGWSGTTSKLYGRYFWTDGDNIYYESGSNHYIYDKTTETFSKKTWNGISGTIYVPNIWKDGNNVYYSYNTTQKMLNKDTSTWTSVSWNGLTNFNGEFVWTDGNNVYFSSNTSQYILNKDTLTWEAITWNDFVPLYGNAVWSDGDNIYYKNEAVFDKENLTWVTGGE